jgi:hypothetical protein
VKLQAERCPAGEGLVPDTFTGTKQYAVQRDLKSFPMKLEDKKFLGKLRKRSSS